MPKVKASQSAPNGVNAWPRDAPLLAATGRIPRHDAVAAEEPVRRDETGESANIRR